MTVRWARSVVGVFTLAMFAGPVAATTCQDICPGTGNCTITSAAVVTPGSVVDCSGRNITVSGYGEIDVTDGLVTLKANNLTIGGGRPITAYRTQPGVPFGMVIQVTGTLDMPGRLVASSDWGGGSISVDAAGDVLMTPAAGIAIEANGTSTDAPGGTIEINSGRHVLIQESVSARGANNANSVATGGTVSITAAGNITISALIDVYGREADAGRISLTALGTVDVSGNPLANPDTVLCSDPNRTGKIETQPNGQLMAEGGYYEGNGGNIELFAREIVIGAAVSAQGGRFVTGGLSEGGSVLLEAGRCGIQINNDINVTSGEGGAGVSGGSIAAFAQGYDYDANGLPTAKAGDITVAANKVLTTKSDANGGDGGDIVLRAARSLSIGNNALLDARGNDPGRGAAVTLDACDVTINSGAQVDVRGYDGGAIHLVGRRTLVVATSATARFKATGTTASGGTDGSVNLEYARLGRCSTDITVACEVSTCPSPLLCSNLPTRTCTIDTDCNNGCETGICSKLCSNLPTRPCTSDATCTGCATGSCLVNPDTGGTTTQFSPAPPMYERNISLETCP